MKVFWLSVALLFGATVAAPGAAVAHRAGGHAPKAAPAEGQKPWGIAGEAKAVKRTIEVTMLDTMRFAPERIEVRQGETVRFVHRNVGKLVHEFVLGTKKELDDHALLMQKQPHRTHDEPHMVQVAPGKARELIWTFNRAGDFDFACLIPGHYQAGMFGTIRVNPR
jgi:uncharacterized cupredoxin-like copper-binding protein